MPEVERVTGVIHDIGYQKYAGPRLGRWYAALALYGQSLRTAFGVGRGVKAKIFPWIVVGLCFGLALIAVVARSQSHQVIIGYLHFTDAVGIPVLLFLAVVAPELVSRDLRANVLPLYFSRPLRRADYALAKLAALVSAVGLLLVGPLSLMYLGGLFSQTDGWSGAWRESTDFLGGVGYALLCAALFSSIAVLVASLAGRRAVAAAAIVAVFLATTPIVGVLTVIGGSTLHQVAPVLNPITLMQGVNSWLYRTHEWDLGAFGPLYAVVALAIMIGCGVLLLLRYRKVSA